MNKSSFLSLFQSKAITHVPNQAHRLIAKGILHSSQPWLEVYILKSILIYVAKTYNLFWVNWPQSELKDIAKKRSKTEIWQSWATAYNWNKSGQTEARKNLPHCKKPRGEKMRAGNLGRNQGSSSIVLPTGLLHGKKKRPPKTKVSFKASYIHRNVSCKSDLILISSADMVLKRT